MNNCTMSIVAEAILLIALLIVMFVVGYNVGYDVGKIHPCAIEEEFRPDDAPSEEECHAWQELERIRAKKK
jgi:hypothetical protein